MSCGVRGHTDNTQQQVSETLRHMGLSVEDEVRCPKSGYSIDMVTHVRDIKEKAGERNSRGKVWAVEFDGPWHFLAARRQRVPLC